MLFLSVLSLLALFLISFWLTGYVRQYALQHDMLDRPNERSSHEKTTPRGGGLGFSAISLASFCLLLLIFPESQNIWIGLLGGGVLVAGIGWLDDRFDLSAKVRIVAHLLAALWAVYWLGGMPQLELGFTTLPLGAAGSLAAIFAFAWSTNLYNFMDGVDGLAGSQAVAVGTITSILLAAFGHVDLAVASGTIAASVGGFLVWNWPPAKIFMGDCGSGLLGFLFAGLALASENRGAIPLLIWTLLMSVFLVDATSTLIRRIIRGEAWHEAHCDHAYQRVVRMGFSHRQVTMVTIGIFGILTILATTAYLWLEYMFPLVALGTAGVFLFWVCLFRLTSGKQAFLSVFRDPCVCDMNNSESGDKQISKVQSTDQEAA